MAAPEGGWPTFAPPRRKAPSSRNYASRWSGCAARAWTPPPAAAAVREHLRRTPTRVRRSRPSRATCSSVALVPGGHVRGARSRRARSCRAPRRERGLRDERAFIAESARLRLENHELMEDLGGGGAPATAREAAGPTGGDAGMTAVADAHAETIAERAARAELAGRVRALGTLDPRAPITGQGVLPRRVRRGGVRGCLRRVLRRARRGPSPGRLRDGGVRRGVPRRIGGGVPRVLGARVRRAQRGVERLAAPVECVALVDELVVLGACGPGRWRARRRRLWKSRVADSDFLKAFPKRRTPRRPPRPTAVSTAAAGNHAGPGSLPKPSPRRTTKSSCWTTRPQWWAARSAASGAPDGASRRRRRGARRRHRRAARRARRVRAADRLRRSRDRLKRRARAARDSDALRARGRWTRMRRPSSRAPP